MIGEIAADDPLGKIRGLWTHEKVKSVDADKGERVLRCGAVGDAVIGKGVPAVARCPQDRRRIEPTTKICEPNRSSLLPEVIGVDEMVLCLMRKWPRRLASIRCATRSTSWT